MSAAPRVALVTGASQGIGRVVAARAGGIRIPRRRGGALDSTGCGSWPQQTGALAVPLDVVDPQAVAAAVTRIESELGPIDLLVNNAGLGGTERHVVGDRPRGVVASVRGERSSGRSCAAGRSCRG